MGWGGIEGTEIGQKVTIEDVRKKSLVFVANRDRNAMATNVNRQE